jgi:DNA-binding NtrC family response regulator
MATVKTILVVEDEEQVRVLAESILRDAGYAVISAVGVEGSQALLQSDRTIDVLFIDLILSQDHEAGLMVAQNARESRAKLPVLYTSGLALNDGMKALFVEPYLFLPKPYTAEQLVESVAYLLVRAQPHEPLRFPDAEPPAGEQR